MMSEKENIGDFSDIDFDKIEDSISSVNHEIYNENRAKTVVVIIISIIASVLLSLACGFSYFIVGFFIFGIYCGSYYSSAKKSLFENIAEKYNLIYKESCVVEGLKTSAMGASWKLSRDVLTGRCQERDARFFNCYVGRKKGKGGSRVTFFEVSLNGLNLPYTLLLFHRKKTVGVEWRYDEKGKDEISISLEDEFSEYYNLYTKDGYGIEVMQIFNKEFLSFLINEKCNFSIELNKDRLYVYTSKIIRDKEDIKEFVETASEAIKRVEPLVVRLKRDFHNLSQYNVN